MLEVQKKLKLLINKRQYYNSYFNRCINRYKKIENYISLYDDFYKSIDSVETSEVINHSSKIFFGINLYDAVKQIDVPYRLKRNKKLCDIIFYKTKIDSHKIIVELHFFKKKLIYFKYLFPAVMDSSKIVNRVKRKYVSKEIDFCSNSNLIVDLNNNYLKIENEVSLTLNYYSLNFGFQNFLKEKQQLVDHRNSLKKEFGLKKFDEIV